jgi:hypothetical protein
MATITLTTSGITNPSTTTRGYTGGINVRPPASAGGFISDKELTSLQYDYAKASDNVRAYPVESTAYQGIRFEFYVPAAYRDISQIDFGIEAYGYDGYTSAYGWTLYVKNNNTTEWDQIADTSGIADETLTGQKTTDFAYWIDAGYRICILCVNKGYDSNGGGEGMQVDYAYVTLTYTPPPFVAKIMMY